MQNALKIPFKQNHENCESRFTLIAERFMAEGLNSNNTFKRNCQKSKLQNANWLGARV
jgi:hypothetical protein